MRNYKKVLLETNEHKLLLKTIIRNKSNLGNYETLESLMKRHEKLFKNQYY